jgi:hypothetical protein
MPDGTYRFETNRPRGSRKDKLLLDAAMRMCVTEETVSAAGKVATMKLGDGGDVKEFEREFPWYEERAETEEETEIIEGKLVEGVDTIQ